MQLVKISHTRCGEWAGTTVLWAEERITASDFARDVEDSKQELLKADEELRKAGISRTSGYGFGPSDQKDRPSQAFLSRHLNLTVQEAQALWNIEVERKQAAHNVARRSVKRFAEYMQDRGYVSFYDHDPELSEHVDWGHQHGRVLSLGGQIESDPRVEELVGTDEEISSSREEAGEVNLDWAEIDA